MPSTRRRRGTGISTKSPQRWALRFRGRTGDCDRRLRSRRKIDLAIANDSSVEFLFHNKGGTFEETGLSAGVAVDGDGRTYAGRGIDFQDYDNDGLKDLLVAQATTSTPSS
jgi:hypothetical protein